MAKPLKPQLEKPLDRNPELGIIIAVSVIANTFMNCLLFPEELADDIIQKSKEKENNQNQRFIYT